MDTELIIAILVGCAASITMNLGKGVQKMKVQVLKTGKKILSAEHRGDFFIWLIGVTMTGGAGILFTLSLKMTEKPSIVSSLNGIGLIALAIFSLIVLKEKVGGREWGAVMLIIMGTGVVQFLNEASGNEQNFTLASLMWCIGVSFVVFTIAVLIVAKLKMGQAFVYAAIAGTFLGLMFIFFKAAGVSTGGGNFVSTLLTPYFIIGFFLGNGAFIMTNLAFFHGSGIVIVPTVNSFLIIIPMVLEIFIFKVMLEPIQYLGVGLIIAGVILLTTGTGHGVEEEQPAAA